MVDNISFKDLDVEELPATSSVLLGAAHHLGITHFVLTFHLEEKVILSWD